MANINIQTVEDLGNKMMCNMTINPLCVTNFLSIHLFWRLPLLAQIVIAEVLDLFIWLPWIQTNWDCRKDEHMSNN